jgi:hypothetical protein
MSFVQNGDGPSEPFKYAHVKNREGRSVVVAGLNEFIGRPRRAAGQLFQQSFSKCVFE